MPTFNYGAPEQVTEDYQGRDDLLCRRTNNVGGVSIIYTCNFDAFNTAHPETLTGLLADDGAPIYDRGPSGGADKDGHFNHDIIEKIDGKDLHCVSAGYLETEVVPGGLGHISPSYSCDFVRLDAITFK